MYESTQHSCVSTACFLLDKFGNSQAHIANEAGTGARAGRRGEPICESTVGLISRLLRTSMEQRDIAVYCGVGKSTVNAIACGRYRKSGGARK